MRASHDLSRVITTFDESSLLPNAGLLPAAVRVQRIGLPGLIDERLKSAAHAASSGTAKFDVRFSLTARRDKRFRARHRSHPGGGLAAVPYWLSTPEVSGADVAETAYTWFAGDKRHARSVRLVVRRVRPTPGSQLALFTA